MALILLILPKSNRNFDYITNHIKCKTHSWLSNYCKFLLLKTLNQIVYFSLHSILTFYFIIFKQNKDYVHNYYHHTRVFDQKLFFNSHSFYLFNFSYFFIFYFIFLSLYFLIFSIRHLFQNVNIKYRSHQLFLFSKCFFFLTLNFLILSSFTFSIFFFFFF